MTAGAPGPEILVTGPWALSDVEASWRERPFTVGPEAQAAADRALQALKDRGSPSHDGLAARMVGWTVIDGRLSIELEPVRWALRLVSGAEAGSISAMCVVRDAAGRWLAGRRAMWVATWRGRWTLGAAGAVEVGENPALTLVRELQEEWAVEPARAEVRGLVRAPGGHVFVVGEAWLKPGDEVTANPEHDAHEWWPADPADWPDYAEPELRATAAMLCSPG